MYSPCWLRHPMNLTVTEAAQVKLREFLQTRPEGGRLRLLVARSHCMGGRGHASKLGLAEEEMAGDLAVEFDGVMFLIDPESAPRLEGVRLDYLEKEDGAGFLLDNPNVTGHCPCGHHDLYD